MGRHAAVAVPRPAWGAELATFVVLVVAMLDFRRPRGRRRATRGKPATATHEPPRRRPSPGPRALAAAETGKPSIR